MRLSLDSMMQGAYTYLLVGPVRRDQRQRVAGRDLGGVDGLDARDGDQRDAVVGGLLEQLKAPSARTEDRRGRPQS